MNRPTSTTNPRVIRNILGATAAALMAYRFIRAADQSVADLLTSITTAAAIVGATVFAAIDRVRAHRQRAEKAEATVIELRGDLLDGDEDRALWDSVEPAVVDHDTCAFGLNVVAINQWRNFPRAG